MSYRLQDVKYETRNFWVLDVGAKGFQVLRKGPTASTVVGYIGRSLGLDRAVAECDRRQVLADEEFDKAAGRKA